MPCPSGIDVRIHNRQLFLNIDDSDEEESTYTNIYDDEDYMDDNKNDQSPSYDITLASVQVTYADIHKLHNDARVHNDDVEENAIEGEESEESKGRDIVTANENEHDMNDLQNDYENDIKQEDDNTDAPITGFNLINNEDDNNSEKAAPNTGATDDQDRDSKTYKDGEDITTLMNKKYEKISRENMSTQKRKREHLPKIHISLLTSNASKEK